MTIPPFPPIDALPESVSSSHHPRTVLNTGNVTEPLVHVLNTGNVAEPLVHTDEIGLFYKQILDLQCVIGCCRAELQNPQILKAAQLQQPATHYANLDCVCKIMRCNLYAVW